MPANKSHPHSAHNSVPCAYTNNFRRNTASKVGAKIYGKIVTANQESLIMMTMLKGKTVFYAMVSHIFNIMKLTIPVIFVALTCSNIWQSSYKIIPFILPPYE
jgi:hypothetical protein